MFTFPAHLFNPATVTLRPVQSVLSGGTALSGDQDVTNTDGGGLWEIEMSGINLITPDQIRAWAAWEDHLESGVTRVIVPVLSLRNAPRPVIGGRPARPSNLLASSDDPYFPEAVGFATPFIVARVTASAPLRASQLQLSIDRGSRLKGGEVFALSHPTKGRRCYRVGRVISRDAQTALVTIRTPLREAVTAPMVADFDWPSTVATLKPQTDISPAITHGRAGTVNIVFREA